MKRLFKVVIRSTNTDYTDKHGKTIYFDNKMSAKSFRDELAPTPFDRQYYKISRGLDHWKEAT